MIAPTFGPEAQVSAAFARSAAQRRAAFLPFLVAGDPNALVSSELVAATVRGGADLIELGIPFSDPLADGPVVAQASSRALAGGMSLDGAMRLARGLGKRLGAVPLLAFTYYNVLFARGLERAAQALAASGFAGAVVPDVPFEESEPLRTAFARFGLVVPMFVSPTTPHARAAQIADAASGFIYLVSRVGVTGTHAGSDAVEERIERLRRCTDKPIVAGFGVAGAAQATRLARVADGVVVGSALVARAAAARTPAQAVDAVEDLCRELAAACSRDEQRVGTRAAGGC